MNLHAQKFSQAAAAAAAIGYTFCALVVYFNIGQRLGAMGGMLGQTPLGGMMPVLQLTPMHYFMGLLGLVVYVYVLTFIAITLYNKSL